MYVTGGCGARYEGEAFGRDYELPNERAYAETCAAIANILWQWRMFLITGEARFFDVLELALFNGSLSGIGLDGKSYFYVNPLADRGRHRRQPYFECACCPPNIARLLPMVPSFLYALGDDGVFVNLYAESEAELTINGAPVRLRQRTDYPWDGEVTLQIGLTQPATFALHLRIPSWCERASVTVNGAEKREGIGGEFVTLKRQWRDGDTIKLSLPMSSEFVICHPFVESNAGRVAIRCGPIVYCLEQVDNPDADVWFIAAKVENDLKPVPMQIGNLPVVAIQGEGVAVEPSAWDGKLYQPLRKLATKPVRFTAIPYFAWANRDAGPMTVWVAKG